MKTAYLIYPFSDIDPRTPYVIGFKISQILNKLGYKVVIKPWNYIGQVTPNHAEDILIGHAHPNPYTIFRRSVGMNGWDKRILCQPFNADMGQLGYLRSVVRFVDCFVAICGKGWHDTLPKVGLRIEDRTKFVDLAVDSSMFPKLKLVTENRGILYIGNNDRCKNTIVLRDLEAAGFTVGSVGANIGLKNHHGYLSLTSDDARHVLKKYRFLVVPSFNDANPTVVLEAMSLGLIPVISHTCGYLEVDGPIVISSHKSENWIIEMRKLVNKKSANLDQISKQNYEKIINHYQWARFCDDVTNIIIRTSRKQGEYQRGELKLIVNELLGNRFFLRPSLLRDIKWYD